MRLSSRYIVFCVCLLLKLCNGEDAEEELPYDFPDSDSEKVVCSAMESGASSMKINVEGPIEYEDALKLMSWNIKYNFKSGTATLTYGAETDWKRNILNLIFDIFSRTCPGVYVPVEFLNVMKELNLIYQNSFANKSDNSAKWENSISSLTDCSQKANGGDYTGRARMIEKVALMGKKGQIEVIDLYPPEEIADHTPQIDLIIDAMWFAFSNAYGACYKKMNARFNTVNNIKKLFYEDFLKPLKTRWVEVGPGVDFGIIVGDYHLDHILMNMRYCVTGTYMKSGLIDRQLIRPVTIDRDEPGRPPLNNKKTGKSIFG